MESYLYHLINDSGHGAMALFACLIIRIFQLIFLAGTVFFSPNKSAGIIFRFIFSAKRTGPLQLLYTRKYFKLKIKEGRR